MVCYKAGYILDENFKLVHNAGVVVKNGIICGITKDFAEFSKDEIKDLGPGIIIPGLINSHTHLELSFLKNRLDYSNGFKDWVKQLISVRSNTSLSEIKKALIHEIKTCIKSGTFALCDISSIDASRTDFENLGIDGWFFYEELGNKGKFLNSELTENISFAAHAPHTTSPELIKAIKDKTNKNNILFSIHCAESKDEFLFMQGKNKDWENFLSSRNIDFSSWNIPCNSSTEYLNNLNVLDSKTLLVHMLDYTKKDLEIIKNSNSSICVCPRSNENLHKRLPDIETFLSFGINICLGTDSLASCESLDMFDEMRFVLDHYKNISPEDLLKMCTKNSAKALLIDKRLGTIKKGLYGKMIYVETKGKDIFESLIFSENNMRKVIS